MIFMKKRTNFFTDAYLFNKCCVSYMFYKGGDMQILRHYGLPSKIVNIIQSLYNKDLCQVIHDMDLSEPFTLRSGVRQGCLLSPMIFSIVIDWVMKRTLDRPIGIQWTLTSQLEDLDYADDIDLLSHTSNQIQMKTTRLQEIARTTGLEINVDKTKCLRIVLTLEDKPLKTLIPFAY